MTMKYNALLLLTAAIWGFAFVAQRAGMEYVGPFVFIGVRFCLGSLVLVPFIIARNRRSGRASLLFGDAPPRLTIAGSCSAGVILFLAAAFQQTGIIYTTAGKAGFITGLYLIIVPILGLVIKQKPGWYTWIGAVLALIGLYLLCMTERLSMAYGDVLVLFSAGLWAVHVLWIGHFSSKIYPLTLACIQFATCSLLGIIIAIATETISFQSISQAGIPILYAGLFSTGVAFTLQVVAQQFVPSANAAIIMSLESVFAAIGGWLILGESFTVHGIAGCVLMLMGMICSQLNRKTLS